ALLIAPILPTLLKLALPTVTVLVAQTAVNIAEAYYVGFLGTDALAGAALVFPIFMLMTMMSNGGLGSGVASSVARAVGAGRRDAVPIALHGLGPFRPHLAHRAVARRDFRRHAEGRHPDGVQRRADQPDRHSRDRRGRPVPHLGAGGLRHFLAPRLYHDPAAV